jgi:hypothetical protein
MIARRKEIMKNLEDRISDSLVFPMMFIFFCGSLALTLSIPYMIAFEGLPAGFLILDILPAGLTLFFGWFLVSELIGAQKRIFSKKLRVAGIETAKKARLAEAEFSRARAEADRQRLESAQAKVEADKAKVEADKAKLEADKVAHAVANEAYKRIMAEHQAKVKRKNKGK